MLDNQEYEDLLKSITPQQREILVRILKDGREQRHIVRDGEIKEEEMIFTIDVTITCSTCGSVNRQKIKSSSEMPIVSTTSTCNLCRERLMELPKEQLVNKILAGTQKPILMPYKAPPPPKKGEENRDLIDEVLDILDEIEEV